MIKKNKNVFILAILLLITVFITYSNHFNNDFHFDDSHTINNNIYIRNIKNLPLFFTDIKTFGTMPDNRGYRPIVTASTAVDYWLGGGYKPVFFHLSMFILFVIQGILMFFLFLKIINIAYKHKWNKYFALFIVGWYLLHPGNAETINYITSRSDSYSTFFVIAALVCYIFSSFCRKYFLYLIPAALGMLTKETAVMFPFFLFFYILFFENEVSLTKIFGSERKLFLKSILKSIPAMVFSIVFAFLIQYIVYKQTFNGGILHTQSNTLPDLLKYQLTQPYVLFTYFISYFLPINLSSDPNPVIFNGPFDIRIYLGFIFVIIMFIFAFICSKKEKFRPISFGILWFFIAAIPTSMLAVLTQASNSHRLFYFYVGISIAVGWTIYLFVIKILPVFNNKTFTRVIVFSAVLLLCTYAYGTYQRNKVWRTEESLWEDIVQKAPQNPRALMNYGLSKMAKGYYFEAEFYFRKALEIWPSWSYLHINIGILKEATQQTAEAEKYFLNAINYSAKNNPDAYYYYAKFLYNQKNYKEAITYLKHSISVSQGYIQSRYLLMSIYSELSFWDLLKTLAEETLQLLPDDKATLNFIKIADEKKMYSQILQEETITNPSPENYLNLSLQYYKQGEYQKCIDACNEALKIKPDYSEAYNNICSAYNAMKMWDKGIEACEKALKINPAYELAKNNLRWAQSKH